MTDKSREGDRAAAFDKGKASGPGDSKVQVRDAGGESTRDDKQDWDPVDEAADETFPASDATAKY